MNLKFFPSNYLPSLVTVADGNHNLLFGYRETPITLEKAAEVYQCMTVNAQTVLEAGLKENPDRIPAILTVTYYFVRARQVLYISMSFPVRDCKLISDPNGANIVMRKINSVYN